MGLIAIAGMVLGNLLITLPLSRWAWRKAKQRGARGWAMLAYWCTLASVGNLIDYVPVRTFTLESDMGSVQKGFGWSPWMIMLVLGVPTLILLAHFLWRTVPAALQWLFPESRAQRVTVAFLSMLALFGFYGAVGFLDGGPVSRQFSMVSMFVLLPFLSAMEATLAWRSAPAMLGSA